MYCAKYTIFPIKILKKSVYFKSLKVCISIEEFFFHYSEPNVQKPIF